MADKKIGEVTHDDNIGGSEKLPMDDAGTAKYATTGDIKQYVIDKIEALTAAESVSTATDKVYLLKSVSGGGSPELKPVSAETLATAVLDYGFGKAAVATVSDTDKIGVKSGSDQKTVTVDALKNYMATNVAIPWASLTEASSASDLANDDYLVFRDTSATGDKKVKVVTYKEYVCAAFKAYVEGLSGLVAETDHVQTDDLIYLVHNTESDGTVARKATIEQLIAAVGSGDVIAPSFTSGNWGTEVAGKIPNWDTTQKKLTKGYAVQNSVRASGTADSNSIPTESAVRGALNTKVDVVEGRQLSKNDYSDAEKAKVANAENAVSPWVEDKTYSVGQYCTHNGCLYGRKVQGSESTFTPSNWDEVPVYPSTSDTTKYLRADKTWQVPPTATNFEGATGGQTPAAGKAGLVPAPTTGDINKFLRGNGNWDDPTTPCAIAPSTVTANKVPQWSGTGKELNDGLAVATSTSGEVSSENKDTTIPTVGYVNAGMLEVLGDVALVEDTPTAGKIPKWADPVSGVQLKALVDGYSVVTAVGATPADTNIATEKAVADHVSAKVPYAKLADVDLTSSTTAATLVDHAVNRLLISTPTGSPATGGTCTLTLPTATTGLSRDFYVVFVQSGTYNAVSTVNFTTQVHGKSGTVSSLLLTKDVSGNSNAYHVYHFFEDNTHLWCVNVFEFVESGSTGGGYVKYASESVSDGDTKNLSNRGVYAFTANADANDDGITFNLPAAQSGTPVDVWVLFKNVSQSSIDIYLQFDSPDMDISDLDGHVNNPGQHRYGMYDSRPASGITLIHFIEVGGVIRMDEKEEVDYTESYIDSENSLSAEAGSDNTITLWYKNVEFVTLDGSVMSFPIEFGYNDSYLARYEQCWFETYMLVTNNASTDPTITIPNGTIAMLPNGITSVGVLFKHGYKTLVRIMYHMKNTAVSGTNHCDIVSFSVEGEYAIPPL